MVKKLLTEESNIHILGRTAQTGEHAAIFWTGGGMEMDISASELWVEFVSDYSLTELWISIEINGCVVARQMLEKGVRRICIFRNMNPSVTKHVRILRDTQAMGHDPDCLLQISAVWHDGEICPMEERKWKLEFVGDSITSGEGAIGARCEQDWIPMFFSAFRTYAVLTADALRADFHIVSQSGWGVVSSFDNNPHKALPDYYEYVCGVVAGERNRRLGANELYRFEQWQPDAVIINLGANDAGAFRQEEAWYDPATGERFKQTLGDPKDIERFKDKAVSFLEKIRSYNSKAHMVWAYGMAGREMLPYIHEAVERYTKRSGDSRVSVAELPENNRDTMGARQHPGAESHRQSAGVLANHLKQILGIEA